MTAVFDISFILCAFILRAILNINSNQAIEDLSQGSILGSLLFNIYINDLVFFFDTVNIASYADDCSPTFSDYIDDAIHMVESHTHSPVRISSFVSIKQTMAN